MVHVTELKKGIGEELCHMRHYAGCWRWHINHKNNDGQFLVQLQDTDWRSLQLIFFLILWSNNSLPTQQWNRTP